MAAKVYDPLSDLGRVKDSFRSLFFNTDDIVRLIMPTLDDTDFSDEANWYGGKVKTTVTGATKNVTLLGHCFDTPYLDGTIPDNRSAIFIETFVSDLKNRYIKTIRVDVSIISHKDAVSISEADKTYFNNIGVYGNRVDCACQVINSALLDPDISKLFGIGDISMVENNPIRLYMPNDKFYGKVISYVYPTFYTTSSNVE